MIDLAPDPAGQVSEMMRWYRNSGKRREDERLWDLVTRAKGPPVDDGALTEANKLLDARATRRGTTPDEELDRLTRKFKD